MLTWVRPAIGQDALVVDRARQTMLFSATMPPDIERMASQYLKDPVRITVGTNSKPVDRIKQKRSGPPPTQVRQPEAELKRREGIILIFGRTQNGLASSTNGSRATGSRSRRSTGAWTKTSDARPWTPSRRARSACWWPPTWRRAAWMSRTSRTSSTMSCLTSPRIISTASSHRSRGGRRDR
jgi:hypothetical protein